MAQARFDADRSAAGPIAGADPAAHYPGARC